jgi:hypothetical protein
VCLTASDGFKTFFRGFDGFPDFFPGKTGTSGFSGKNQNKYFFMKNTIFEYFLPSFVHIKSILVE